MLFKGTHWYRQDSFTRHSPQPKDMVVGKNRWKKNRKKWKENKKTMHQWNTWFFQGVEAHGKTHLQLTKENRALHILFSLRPITTDRNLGTKHCKYQLPFFLSQIPLKPSEALGCQMKSWFLHCTPKIQWGLLSGRLYCKISLSF